jgi:hypothetical protein
VDMAGDRTVLLTRWELRDREPAGWGYGHNFVEATTRAAKGCEKTSGHHRVIKFVSDILHLHA